MLFKVPQIGKGTVRKENDSIDAIPEFNDLTDKQLRLMILMFDYQSPFRQKKKEDRWKLAALAAGYEPENTKDKVFHMRVREIVDGKNPKMNVAIKKYLEMQHDEDVELLETVQHQINTIKTMVKKNWEDPIDVEKVNKLVNSLPELRERQRELARNAKLDYTFGEQEEENRNISTIDQVMLDEAKDV